MWGRLTQLRVISGFLLYLFDDQCPEIDMLTKNIIDRRWHGSAERSASIRYYFDESCCIVVGIGVVDARKSLRKSPHNYRCIILSRYHGKGSIKGSIFWCSVVLAIKKCTAGYLVFAPVFNVSRNIRCC